MVMSGTSDLVVEVANRATRSIDRPRWPFALADAKQSLSAVTQHLTLVDEVHRGQVPVLHYLNQHSHNLSHAIERRVLS